MAIKPLENQLIWHHLPLDCEYKESKAWQSRDFSKDRTLWMVNQANLDLLNLQSKPWIKINYWHNRRNCQSSRRIWRKQQIPWRCSKRNQPWLNSKIKSHIWNQLRILWLASSQPYLMILMKNSSRSPKRRNMWALCTWTWIRSWTNACKSPLNHRRRELWSLPWSRWEPKSCLTRVILKTSNRYLLDRQPSKSWKVLISQHQFMDRFWWSNCKVP